ncbi:hypothetical protein CVS40_12899 [Lucilia cuprina]|nr:hypothetical protein CVS40_12899 [Lucilia cuprina]
MGNINWKSFKDEIISRVIVNFPPLDTNLSNSDIDNFVEEFSSSIEQVTNNHSKKIELKNKRTQKKTAFPKIIVNGVEITDNLQCRQFIPVLSQIGMFLMLKML